MIVKNKLSKKSSQLEIIISFSIFIIFLVLIFIVVKPTKLGNEKVLLVKHLEEQLPTYLARELIVTSVINKTQLNMPCFFINSLEEGKGMKVVVTDEANNKVATRIDSDKLYINSTKNFHHIYYFNELKEMTFEETNCKDLTTGNEYSMGLIKNITLISKIEIEKLKDKVDNPLAYEQLKKELGIPEGSDFAFIFKNSEGIEIFRGGNRENIGNVEVSAEEFPFNYIDEEANIYQGWLNIQVW